MAPQGATREVRADGTTGGLEPAGRRAGPVFEPPRGPEGLAQELRPYRRHGFAPADLPADRPVTPWLGLDDDVVPPAKAFAPAPCLPNCEAHFVPGGHFVAASLAGRIIDRLAGQRAGDRPPA